ncbi:MAG TPA: hypothetical protein PKK06_14035 [Phycisphaerae bacterium]|nr:hypothetical protein [Phycisphaerae bacterium]HNU46409.1 hypothetical protein [Phycisphaerae bacterium]
MDAPGFDGRRRIMREQGGRDDLRGQRRGGEQRACPCCGRPLPPDFSPERARFEPGFGPGFGPPARRIGYAGPRPPAQERSGVAGYDDAAYAGLGNALQCIGRYCLRAFQEPELERP